MLFMYGYSYIYIYVCTSLFEVHYSWIFHCVQRRVNFESHNFQQVVKRTETLVTKRVFLIIFNHKTNCYGVSGSISPYFIYLCMPVKENIQTGAKISLAVGYWLDLYLEKYFATRRNIVCCTYSL